MASDGVLDGECTSREWQQRAGDVCVLPIGAFEQHSVHLPLAADNIEAEYFGAFVARELGAALLPVLAYGTSLEHTGFRGTITLRPETLMRIVRDVAEECEAQGFRTMVLLNCHGGNFCLTPAVRDINRRDRPLKVLKVDFWTFVDEALLDAPRQGLTDIHAGEFETSLLLALRPDLVKDERPDLAPSVERFQQADLTTFGVGYFSDSGAMGPSSLASEEKGRRIVASIERNMMPWIRQRLEWLERNRTYSGKGQDQR